MSPELVEVMINLGGHGVLIWLVWEMRKEAKDQTERMWRVIDYLLCDKDPDCDPPSASSLNIHAHRE